MHVKSFLKKVQLKCRTRLVNSFVKYSESLETKQNKPNQFISLTHAQNFLSSVLEKRNKPIKETFLLSEKILLKALNYKQPCNCYNNLKPSYTLDGQYVAFWLVSLINNIEITIEDAIEEYTNLTAKKQKKKDILVTLAPAVRKNESAWLDTLSPIGKIEFHLNEKIKAHNVMIDSIDKEILNHVQQIEQLKKERGELVDSITNIQQRIIEFITKL